MPPRPPTRPDSAPAQFYASYGRKISRSASSRRRGRPVLRCRRRTAPGRPQQEHPPPHIARYRQDRGHRPLVDVDEQHLITVGHVGHIACVAGVAPSLSNEMTGTPPPPHRLPPGPRSAADPSPAPTTRLRSPRKQHQREWRQPRAPVRALHCRTPAAASQSVERFGLDPAPVTRSGCPEHHRRELKQQRRDHLGAAHAAPGVAGLSGMGRRSRKRPRRGRIVSCRRDRVEDGQLVLAVSV